MLFELLLSFGYFVKYYFFIENIFDHMLNNCSKNHQRDVCYWGHKNKAFSLNLSSFEMMLKQSNSIHGHCSCFHTLFSVKIVCVEDDDQKTEIPSLEKKMFSFKREGIFIAHTCWKVNTFSPGDIFVSLQTKTKAAKMGLNKHLYPS